MESFYIDNWEYIEALGNRLKDEYPKVNVKGILNRILNDKKTDNYGGLHTTVSYEIRTLEGIERYITQCVLKTQKMNSKLDVFHGRMTMDEFLKKYPEHAHEKMATM